MGQTMHDREFKEQVVKRILNKETSVGKMAEELDLHYTTIRNWVRQHKRDGQDAFPGSGTKQKKERASDTRSLIGKFWWRRSVPDEIHSGQAYPEKLLPLKLNPKPVPSDVCNQPITGYKDRSLLLAAPSTPVEASTMLALTCLRSAAFYFPHRVRIEFHRS
jgi:transposase-like protein